MKIRHTLVPDVEQFKQYYSQGEQGGSIAGFRGARIQKGYGIWNFFKTIACFATPLVKRGAQAIGKRALGAAIDVGHDILAAKNVKQAIKGHSVKAVKDIDGFSVPNGNLSGNQANIFQGPLPVRVVIGMIDADAYNGVYTKNPFSFKNYNTTFLGLTVNGEHLPGKPFQLRFTPAGGTNYVSAYQTLYAGTNKMFQNQGNGITRDEYANGYTMYVFDLTADLGIGDHFQPIRNGNVSLECQFGMALDTALNIVVLGEFQNLIEIDANHNILCDLNN